MSATYSDKVISRHALDDDARGPFTRVSLSAVLGHDATIALLIDEFRRRKLSVWDRDRVLFANDHFSPPATIERAEISNRFLAFAREEGITHLHVDRGICHQLLIESPLCTPGSVIAGADSHTVTGGALGSCATGMGSTDIIYALATGTTWLRRPASIQVIFEGVLPDECSGRDIALALMQRFGEGGARYRCIEMHDRTEHGISIDDRCAAANMGVEMGAKFSVFVPDAVTAAYCAERDGCAPDGMLAPDADAEYEQVVRVDLSALEPLAAMPYSPANVAPLTQVPRETVTSAFIGSCAGGRLRDLRDAAEALEGRQVHPLVRCVVIPASSQVLQAALEAGYIETLLRAGAVLNQPSCGACGGIDKGVLGSVDVCVSTSNRNYRGRMGHWDSRTYLASARTVAQAAMTGTIGGGAWK